MEQDAFRGNDTWKDQSGDASIVFLSAELEEGRVIEEAKNHPGERGQQKRIILRERSRHVCSLLVDCRSLTPLCLAGRGEDLASARVTQYTRT